MGAAIDLTAWQASYDGIPVVVNFTYVVIRNHESNLQKDRTLLGVGALYTDSIPIQFNVYAEFDYNFHTALAAVGSSIQVMPNCIFTFYKNKGRNGGAISLLGNSFLQASKNSLLSFDSNTAQLKGGAIYAEVISKHDLITPPNCFIRYENILDHPRYWESSFAFFDNKASGKDNAIYTTTVVPCEWKEQDGGVKQSLGANGTVFCWKNWEYISNGTKIENCMEQMQTDPKAFSVPNTC